ncbi:ADP-sugar diphosphatase [Spironucleus salmonicida]|uniref:ADP-sugar diphosphatase n=1 Tax=Spironucleus salmonicida TaxID=348837 RepID=V6LJK3_9EUKA|nr:ADP-sugar diphosphatase [Spironucleus salmonicida]|eukprot:EST43896.1 NUDIX hydrolase [Spironucleus salmonicida]
MSKLVDNSIKFQFPEFFPPNFIQLLDNFVPFQNYINNIDANIIISEIIFQSIDLFGPRIGFLKFKVIAQANNKALPGIVFMRGGSVAVLIIVNKTHILLTRQARVPIGQFVLETPAGMLDGDNNFSGVAAKEIQEECGITILSEHLRSLGEVMMSPGGCDEVVKLFVTDIQLSQDKIEEILSKIHGEGDHEQISCKLVTIDEAYSVNDAKLLCCLARYNK